MQERNITTVKESAHNNVSLPKGRTVSLCPAGGNKRDVSQKTEGGPRKPYLFHPRQLDLKLSLAVDIYYLERLREGWVPSRGHAGRKRDLQSLRRNMSDSFEVPCYSFSDLIIQQNRNSVRPPSSSSIHCGFFDVPV